jgi:hypothetical protein
MMGSGRDWALAALEELARRVRLALGAPCPQCATLRRELAEARAELARLKGHS